jgi:chromosome segregation ATPase
MSEDLIREVLRRQDIFSEQLGEVAGNQTSMLERMDRLEARQEGSSDEYGQLVDFLGQKFGGLDRRFEAVDRRFEAVDRHFEVVDHRLVKLEVSVEGVRDEIKILAEAIGGTNQRLDRFLERLEHLEAG